MLAMLLETERTSFCGSFPYHGLYLNCLLSPPPSKATSDFPSAWLSQVSSQRDPYLGRQPALKTKKKLIMFAMLSLSETSFRTTACTLGKMSTPYVLVQK
jgi:hypothetical protein